MALSDSGESSSHYPEPPRDWVLGSEKTHNNRAVCDALIRVDSLPEAEQVQYRSNPHLQVKYVLSRDVALPISRCRLLNDTYQDSTLRAANKELLVVIPKGFRTDGASGAIDAWGVEDWLLHDYLYERAGVRSASICDAKTGTELYKREFSRAEADSVFLWSWRFFHRWAFVRAFGEKTFR